MSQVTCKVTLNRFCYVCGLYIIHLKQVQNFTTNLKNAYRFYFSSEFEVDCKPWTPNVCCASCYSVLLEWFRGLTIRTLPFSRPAIWHKPSLHPEECYFCQIDPKGYNRKNRKLIQYPDVPSMEKPVFQEGFLPPKPPDVPLLKPASSFSENSAADSKPLEKNLSSNQCHFIFLHFLKTLRLIQNCWEKELF